MLRYIFYSISLPYYYQKECPFSFLSLSPSPSLTHSLTHSSSLPLSYTLSLSLSPFSSLRWRWVSVDLETFPWRTGRNRAA